MRLDYVKRFSFASFYYFILTLHQYYVHNSSAALWKEDDIRQAAKDIYILIAHCDLRTYIIIIK